MKVVTQKTFNFSPLVTHQLGNRENLKVIIIIIDDKTVLGNKQYCVPLHNGFI